MIDSYHLQRRAIDRPALLYCLVLRDECEIINRILSGAAGAFFDCVALRSREACARCGVEGAADESA